MQHQKGPRDTSRRGPRPNEIPVDTVHAQTTNFTLLDFDGPWDRSKKRPEWHDEKTDCQVKIYGPYLQFEVSIRRLLNSRNTYALPLEDLNIFFEYLRGVFKKLHIRCRMEDFQILRIDLTRDFLSREPVFPIIGALSRINSYDYYKQRGRPERYDTPYTRWEKTGKELAIYDKTLYYFPNDLAPPWNVLRCEARLLSPRACRAVGIENLSCLSDLELLHSLWGRSFQTLFEEAARVKIFQDGYAQAKSVQNLEKLVEAGKIGPSDIPCYISALGGIEIFTRSIGGEDGLDMWVSRLNAPPWKKSRIRKVINQMRAYAEVEFAHKPSTKALLAFQKWMSEVQHERRKWGGGNQ